MCFFFNDYQALSLLQCFFFLNSVLFHFYFWLHHVACRILVAQPGLNLCPLDWEHSLHHWTIREIPEVVFWSGMNSTRGKSKFSWLLLRTPSLWKLKVGRFIIELLHKTHGYFIMTKNSHFSVRENRSVNWHSLLR